jgi:hypothetical protein
MIINIYHGTSATNINNVLDFPKAAMSINGVGFYCTLDLNVAQQYGSQVCVWQVEHTFFDKLDIITRPIDQRYVEGLETYNECMKGGTELVLTQHAASLMAVYCDDAFAL